MLARLTSVFKLQPDQEVVGLDYCAGERLVMAPRMARRIVALGGSS